MNKHTTNNRKQTRHRMESAGPDDALEANKVVIETVRDDQEAKVDQGGNEGSSVVHCVAAGDSSVGNPLSDGEVPAESQRQPSERQKSKSKHQAHFIYVMTLAQLIVLIIELVKNGGIEALGRNPWAGPKIEVLLDMGAKYGPYMHPPKSQRYRYFTPIFLHAGIFHFIANMLLQLNIGRDLEMEYGALRIGPIYLIAGIGGNVASALFLPNQLQVGASGSLYGLMGCMFIDLFRHWARLRKVKRNPWKILIQMSVQMLVSLAMGLLPGVDNFAHIGGLLTGTLAGLILLPRINLVKRAAIYKVAVATGAVVGLVVFFYYGVVLFNRNVNGTEWCQACTYVSCLSSVFDCNSF